MDDAVGSARALGVIATASVVVGIAAEMSAGAAAAFVLFAIPGNDLLDVGLWIAAGCGVLGVAGWVVVTLFFSTVPPAAGLGAGIAVGGGVGAVVRLLAFGEDGSQSETVTVDMDDSETPGPRPADLFEANPDPLLYYDTSDGEPVVRAGNPAFEGTFGGTDDALDGATLPAALNVVDGDDIVRAATAGEPFDAVCRCETAGGMDDLRIRVVPVGGGTRGYVVCTEPVEEG